MRITVQVKTNAKKTSVERVSLPVLGFTSGNSEVVYKVSVNESPIQGRANDAFFRALAEYFDCAPSCVSIVAGSSAKKKIVDIIQ